MRQVKQFLVQEILETNIKNQTHHWHWRVEFDDGQIEDYHFNCPFNGDAASHWMMSMWYAKNLRRSR